MLKNELTANNLNWIAVDKLETPIKAKTRIRYLHKEAPSLIKPIDDNLVKVIFDEPQRAIAPGQFAVFYDNDIVIGAGIIESDNCG